VASWFAVEQEPEIFLDEVDAGGASTSNNARP